MATIRSACWPGDNSVERYSAPGSAEDEIAGREVDRLRDDGDDLRDGPDQVLHVSAPLEFAVHLEPDGAFVRVAHVGNGMDWAARR
jgi:hypothetical protein